MAVDLLGYIIGEGFLLVVQIEFVLFKEDFHPASLFLIGGPKVLLKKCWRALPPFSHLWRWDLKIYLEFIYFITTSMALVSSVSSPLSSKGFLLVNMKNVEHLYGLCKILVNMKNVEHSYGLFLVGFMLIFWKH